MTIAQTTSFSVSEAPRALGRSVGAVLAGLLSVVVLSTLTDAVMHATQVFPPAGEVMSGGLFGLATAYRLIFGVLGGYVTARLAPRAPLRHALILGAIGFVLSCLGALATIGRGPEFGPMWYPLALVVTALPCSWAGAKLWRPRA